jgi:type IV secretion system protein VirB1
MASATFVALALTCAPQVHTGTVAALVQVESGFNPWAIGVVGGSLEHQPHDRAEALATARALRRAGWNFSVGLGQINVGNFARLGLTLESAFDPCTNLAAMQRVLVDCFDRVAAIPPNTLPEQPALRRALSCYYSGNFSTGVQQGYVHRVAVAAAALRLSTLPVTSKEPV